MDVVTVSCDSRSHDSRVRVACRAPARQKQDGGQTAPETNTRFQIAWQGTFAPFSHAKELTAVITQHSLPITNAIL